MTESNAVIVRHDGPLMDFTPEQVLGVMNKVHALIEKVLKEGKEGDCDFGIIPGTKKPTLFKAGAEKLNMMFRFAPTYKVEREYDGPHLTVTAVCELRHIHTNSLVGSGIGLCTSKESKYAYRQSSPKCPACKKEAVIKGKQEFGGGWVCYKKKGGCGAKYKDGDTAIEAQPMGRVPNEDVADQHNTVVKMACKRAYIDATLKATAASSIFTQDQDDADERREIAANAESADLSGSSQPPPPSHGGRISPGKPAESRAAVPPSGDLSWFEKAHAALAIVDLSAENGREELEATWKSKGFLALYQRCSKPDQERINKFHADLLQQLER